MNEIYELTTQSEQNTTALGSRIGKLIHPGICILFYGELGAGKTVFIRGICEALKIDSKIVRSPSFTLLNEYKGIHPVAHVDLYRLEGDVNAIKSLSLDEYLEDFILLVEWAENGDYDMDDIIRIKIETDTDNKDTRKFVFSATGEKAKKILDSFIRIE